MLARLTHPLVLAFLLALVILGVGEVVSPGFAQGDQVTKLLTVSAILGIVAAGQGLVVIGGREGIDLSVGALISLGAVLAGNVMSKSNGAILPAFLVSGGVTFADRPRQRPRHHVSAHSAARDDARHDGRGAGRPHR